MKAPQGAFPFYPAMDFDFDRIAVPFRMQPGLRRVAPGAAQLTPAAPGSRHLHEKMDHLISRQWQRLAEIQQMQLEIMQEATRSGRRP